VSHLIQALAKLTSKLLFLQHRIVISFIKGSKG